MIGSVQEFARLCTSDNEEDFMRAMTDVAPTFIWEEVIRKRPELAEYVAQAQNLPDTVFETIALFAPWRARYLVAMQERTPAYVLAKLAKDGDSRVQKAAVANELTPLKVIAELREDANEEIAQLARLTWTERAEKRAGKHSGRPEATWDVPQPPGNAESEGGEVSRYKSYFDELCAQRGLTEDDVVRGFDPRDSQLPLAPEGPWVVAPWGDEGYVVGSQRGAEFAAYEVLPDLEAAVSLVSRLVREKPETGELPANAVERGHRTAVGIDARTISRDGKPGSNELRPGDMLDCFDDDKAQFLFAMGTPLAQRGIRLNNEKPYRVFEVMAPLPLAVLEGLTAKTSSNPGGGAIVVLDKPLRWYLDHNFLRELR